jgi:serine protease Do
MRMIAISLLLGAPGLAAPDPLAELERRQQELFNRVAPSVVFLSRGNTLGSGFFVEERLILTNAHVVKGHDKIDVVLHDGKRLEGRVIERAEDEVDLALVEIAESGRPLSLASGTDIRVGTWVASVGHGMGGVWSYTTGMISNIYPRGVERPIFQTQIPLNPGASGGPIFDRNGKVLGIVTSGIETSNSINFAIRSEVALQSLSRLSGKCECLVIDAPKGAAVFVDGALRGRGPRVVIPAESRTYKVFRMDGDKILEKTATYPKQKAIDLR